MATKSFIAFVLGDRTCALPLSAVREVLHMAALARPPGLPPLLEGILDLGGSAVPVVNAARVLGLPRDEPGLYTPLVLLRGTDPPTALLVKEVNGIVTVAQGALLPVRQEHSLNGCVAAEVHSGGIALHVLSPERLLLEEERERLRTLSAQVAGRLNELRAQS